MAHQSPQGDFSKPPPRTTKKPKLLQRIQEGMQDEKNVEEARKLQEELYAELGYRRHGNEGETEGTQDHEEQHDNTHGDPQQKLDLPDDGFVAVKADETGLASTANEGYAQSSSLSCLLCKLDGTVPYSKKALTYTRTTLDEHLKSDYHSRASQLVRAFVIDYGASPAGGPCTLCDEICTSATIIKHMSEEHEEQLVV